MSHTVAITSSSSNPSSSRAVAPRRGVLRWLCILGCIAFAGFLAMFSFDTPPLTIDFVIHNIPALIILLGGVLAWWRAGAGAAWMFAACIAGVIFYQGFNGRWDWMAAIIGPPLLIALMLTIDAFRRSP